MKVSTFIERPVLSAVISITIMVAGIIGLFTLPVEQYPDIAPPTVMVSTTYFGANAETMQKSVVAPLEEAINGVEDMTYMTSTATNSGTATITIYFQQGTDPDMAAVNVQNRVSKATGQLPAEVTQVGVTTSKRQTSMLQIFSLYSPDGSYDENFLSNYISINLKPEILRISGVGELMVMGGDYSMRIWMKPDVMAQYKLIPSDVTSVLAEQNIESATGSLGENSDETYQYTMKYSGRLLTPEEFGDIVIRSTEDGEVLKLKEIADIELGKESYAYIGQTNGKPGISCMVFQTAGSNATEVNNKIDAFLEEASKDFPKGIEVVKLMSTNDFLYASIHEVVKTLIEAIILVILVVYVFLQDFRSTLIPAIAIPVALIATFFVLKLIGFSINLLTLSAMVLAIAIVVDDAIVVVEGVHAKLDQGYKSARAASIDAMSELGGAIVSITLVMMSVFIPVSFMGGTAGIFYRQFGLTMAIAIGFSALNALTLSPALCAIFLKPHDEHGEKKSTFISRFHTGFNVAYDKMLKKYKNNVLFFIQKKWLSFGLVAGSIVLLIFFMKITPTGMVPNEDTGTIMGVVTLPPGTSQERAMEVLNRVDSLVAADPAVESRTMISGFSFIGGQGPSYGSLIIKLKNWEERSTMQNSTVVYATLFMRAQKIIKEAQVLFFAPPMIPGYSASSDIELNMQDKTGGDLNHFFDVVNDYTAALEARPEINSAKTSFNPNFPQYLLRVDLAKAAKLGINVNESMETLQSYVGSFYSSNFVRFGQMYKVMLQAAPEYRMNPEDLFSLYAKNKEGNMVPYSNFMTMERVYGPSQITRYNLFTSAMITGEAAPGVSSGEALAAVEEIAAEVLPRGYDTEWSGVAKEEKESGGQTLVIFAICLAFVYLLLAAQYESLLLPLPVILSLPAGVFGSFFLLYVVGLENNIYAQVALVMLIGLLGKNAILIIEVANQCRKEGVCVMGAAIQGATSRLRPILMTSFAFISGLIPLTIASGAGALGNRSIGTAAAGGMLIGTFVGIFLIPGLYVIFESLATYFKKRKEKEQIKEDEYVY